MEKLPNLLTQLLKKGSFNWDLEAKAVSEALKNAMTTLPTLKLPDFSKTLILEIDVSSKGLGVGLMQGRPVAFLYQAILERGQFKSLYERDLIAMVMAVPKWHHYLLDLNQVK